MALIDAALLARGGTVLLHIQGKQKLPLRNSVPLATGASAGASASAIATASSSHLRKTGLPFRVSRIRVISPTPATRSDDWDAIPDGVDDGSDDDDGDMAAEILGLQEDWMARKPQGFGLKTYDTGLEDQLLKEIEAEKEAAAKAKGNKKAPKKKALQDESPPDGVEVFMGSLPRKRNVERDLRASMKSVKGLLHVRPVLSAAQKSTREPVCKGFAFLTFDSIDNAETFIRRFNGSAISFGKTEKVVTCGLASATSPFKKQASPAQPSQTPRLEVRETSPSPIAASSPAPSSYSSVSFVAEEATVASSSDDDIHVSSTSTVSWDSDGLELELHVENEDFYDDDQWSEDDLAEAESEIWAALEDDDDLEVDLELQEEFSDEDPHSEPAIDLLVNEGFSYAAVEGQSDIQTEHGEEIGSRLSEGTIEEKDRRIQQLESELKALQLQFKKGSPPQVTPEAVMEPTPESRERAIESLERRILGRAKAASSKESNQRKTSKKVPDSKKTARPKGSSQVKVQGLGAASRLRKKERKIYTDVLSKYSAPAKETVS